MRLISCILLFCLLGGCCSSEKKSPVKPNVVFILADDLGYGDLQCYGNPYIETPEINKLANHGILFTHYYSPAPLCAPARAAILTGMYNHRTGAIDVSSNRGIDRIALSYKTMGDYFKSEGYSTGLIGKWHNGLYDLQYHPNKRGFDYFFGFLNGIQDYWSWNLDLNGTNVPSDGRYLTDVITESSLEFMMRNKEKPFFLFIAHHAPHIPYQAPERLVKKYMEKGKGVFNEKVATLYAMIESMDRGIGMVVNELKDLGLSDNTIIVFTSDNGAQNTGENLRYQAGLSGTKGIVLEEGIRVPAIVSWPGKFPQNKIFTGPVHGCDWLPTLLSLTNNTSGIIKNTDGHDISEILLGKSNESNYDRDLYFQKNRYYPVPHSDAAIVKGKWKLYWPGIKVTMKKEDKDNPSVWKGATEPHWEMPCDTVIPHWKDIVPLNPQLFNLVEDPAELYDLSANHPEIVNELTRKWDSWFSDVMKDYRKSWKEIKNTEKRRWSADEGKNQ
ncbi:sulfatase-like hydrolase/transferase [Maribellus maritimus]|uniref:sulfatase-like hydrolase/transferase n=1 Tax=Maribellus maritimus TaxID=2870838 RepID=UPI001EEA93B0|nr:sulfatase-like hydrolase/transferase [Maribellus maritimus]